MRSVFEQSPEPSEVIEMLSFVLGTPRRGLGAPLGAISASTMLVFVLSGACAPDMKPPPRVATAQPRDKVRPARGVCPPYKLRDEAGQVIDPVAGQNADKPYSPRQTCGLAGCHDYETITQGFHFTQGKGEAVPAEHRSRYAWVTSPGQYGGRW